MVVRSIMLSLDVDSKTSAVFFLTTNLSPILSHSAGQDSKSTPTRSVQKAKINNENFHPEPYYAFIGSEIRIVPYCHNKYVFNSEKQGLPKIININVFHICLTVCYKGELYIESKLDSPSPFLRWIAILSVSRHYA